MNKNENQEDEPGKLFVGGLSWETTKESLSNYFSQFGEVTDCVVMMNTETGKSRGFGFITFRDPCNVDLVMSKTPHSLDSRTIDPKPCNPRSMQLKKKNNTHKIFLGGLPNDITESDIKTFFGNYGNVSEVVIMYDQEKQKCRGFGFLSFDTLDAVTKACDDHFVHIKGKKVECKRAQTNQNRGMQQGMGNGSGSWNQMGGQMPSNGMGGYQGWGSNQGGGFNQQSGNGYQSYGYGGSQQQFGGQPSYGNYSGNFNNGYGNYDPQSSSNGGGQGYNMGGAPMGQNQMGTPAVKDNSSYSNNYGGYNNQSGNFDNGITSTGGQNEGPPSGRGGAQQNQGYHPYRR